MGDLGGADAFENAWDETALDALGIVDNCLEEMFRAGGMAQSESSGEQLVNKVGAAMLAALAAAPGLKRFLRANWSRTGARAIPSAHPETPPMGGSRGAKPEEPAVTGR